MPRNTGIQMAEDEEVGDVTEEDLDLLEDEYTSEDEEDDEDEDDDDEEDDDEDDDDLDDDEEEVD